MADHLKEEAGLFGCDEGNVIIARRFSDESPRVVIEAEYVPAPRVLDRLKRGLESRLSKINLFPRAVIQRAVEMDGRACVGIG